MLERRQIELEYEWKRLHNLIQTKVHKIFPEALSSRGMNEQPYALRGTVNINQALNNSNVLLIIGPCLIAGVDVKKVVDIARNRISNNISQNAYLKQIFLILNRQPSLQNVISIGAYIDNIKGSKRDILCIMETYEVALLLANNDHEFFNENKELLLELSNNVAKRIESMIENVRQRRNIKSKIIYFYTHENRENKLVKELIEFISKDNIKPREKSYFIPKDWQSISKTRVEIFYTKIFIEKVKDFLNSKYDSVILCENYKHFSQINDGSFILPSQMFGNIDNRNWLGLIPLPSLINEGEMDANKPLFLGYPSITEIMNQFKKMNANHTIYNLGSYALSLLPFKEVCRSNFIELLNTVYKAKQKYLLKSKVREDLESLISKEIKEMYNKVYKYRSLL